MLTKLPQTAARERRKNQYLNLQDSGIPTDQILIFKCYSKFTKKISVHKDNKTYTVFRKMKIIKSKK